MVKGVSRQVIVINSPDRRYFEQAIFILRRDISTPQAAEYPPIVEEARRIAERCIRRRWRRRCAIPAPAWALLGGAAVALLWLFLPQ